jgi:predicted alpha/beta-hydrolase family hydrolase
VIKLNDLTYRFYHKQSANRVNVVLHGSGLNGLESPFIASIIESLAQTGQSVFGFNFPYCERGEEASSGPELKEEVEALRQVISSLQNDGYKITIIGKSLGGIVASFYLDQYPSEDIELIVLGYVVGDVKDEAAAPNLKAIIQGENDRFGSPADVKSALGVTKAKIITIKDADHSYRNVKKEPQFQDEAIAELLKVL